MTSDSKKTLDVQERQGQTWAADCTTNTGNSSVSPEKRETDGSGLPHSSASSNPARLPCDLCAGRDFETVSRRDRKRKQLNTVVCRGCGLVSHAHIPTDAELATYYKRQYRQEYNGEYIPSAARFLRDWRYGQDLFQRLSDFVQPSDRVFEVGVGIGCGLKQFQLAGCEASGIEPGEGFRIFARDTLRLPVAGCMLTDVPRESKYDLVLLRHVLEHFNSPTRALRHIHGMLSPGGRLYVEVPNLNAPHAAPRKLFHYAHIYNFTPATLLTLARKCGFEVVGAMSGSRDVNITAVLAARGRCAVEVDSDSYRSTMRALGRYSTFTYHFRWHYVRQRLASLRHRTSDRLLAEEQVARILDEIHPEKVTRFCRK